MRVLVFCSLLFTACEAPTSATAPSRACDAKRARLEAQIEKAKSAGREDQAAGLQRALQANKASCTDESVAREREEQIAKAQHEVTDRERDLHEAQTGGDPEEIAKRRAKLDEAKAELADAQSPLP